MRGAAWGVSGVFLARGAVYIPSDLLGGPGDTYERLDLALYSPLSLALGGGTAWRSPVAARVTDSYSSRRWFPRASTLRTSEPAPSG